MNIRYQNGHVRRRKRKDGSSCWVFMWREQDSSGCGSRYLLFIQLLFELVETLINRVQPFDDFLVSRTVLVLDLNEGGKAMQPGNRVKADARTSVLRSLVSFPS